MRRRSFGRPRRPGPWLPRAESGRSKWGRTGPRQGAPRGWRGPTGRQLIFRGGPPDLQTAAFQEPCARWRGRAAEQRPSRPRARRGLPVAREARRERAPSSSRRGAPLRPRMRGRSGLPATGCDSPDGRAAASRPEEGTRSSKARGSRPSPTDSPPDGSALRLEEQCSRWRRRPWPGHDQEIRPLLLMCRRVPERRRYHPPSRKQGDRLAVKGRLPHGIARLRERGDRSSGGDHGRGRLKETVTFGRGGHRAPVERRRGRLKKVREMGESPDRERRENCRAAEEQKELEVFGAGPHGERRRSVARFWRSSSRVSSLEVSAERTVAAVSLTARLYREHESVEGRKLKVESRDRTLQPSNFDFSTSPGLWQGANECRQDGPGEKEWINPVRTGRACRLMSPGAPGRLSSRRRSASSSSGTLWRRGLRRRRKGRRRRRARGGGPFRRG